MNDDFESIILPIGIILLTGFMLFGAGLVLWWVWLEMAHVGVPLWAMICIEIFLVLGGLSKSKKD